MPDGNSEYIEDQRALNAIIQRSLTAAQLADELGIGQATVYRWIRKYRDLPVFFLQTGPKRQTPLFPVPEIYAWFEEHEATRRGPK
jgi:predicted DNA-binding transcriptional regulator AlpA